MEQKTTHKIGDTISFRAKGETVRAKIQFIYENGDCWVLLFENYIGWKAGERIIVEKDGIVEKTN